MRGRIRTCSGHTTHDLLFTSMRFLLTFQGPKVNRSAKRPIRFYFSVSCHEILDKTINIARLSYDLFYLYNYKKTEIEGVEN